MQTADLRDGDELAPLSGFDLVWYGCVALKRQMWARFVVVLEAGAEDAYQMGFIQQNDVAQTLSADRTDQAFHKRILPGRSRRDHDFLDVRVFDGLAQARRRR